MSEKTGSNEPIEVSVGHNAVLPCNLKNPSDKAELRVNWAFNGNITVLVYKSLGVDKDNQDPEFEPIASFFLKEMLYHNERIDFFLKEGDILNISLILTNVSETHSGNYTCGVLRNSKQDRICNVTLIVGEYR